MNQIKIITLEQSGELPLGFKFPDCDILILNLELIDYKSLAAAIENSQQSKISYIVVFNGNFKVHKKQKVLTSKGLSLDKIIIEKSKLNELGWSWSFKDVKSTFLSTIKLSCSRSPIIETSIMFWEN